MSQNLSRQLRILKEPVRSKRGAVAAKNQAAADIGARILSSGGNAIDAAIAAAFALSILEPWTSGLGSNGCMTVWDARKCRGQVVDFAGAPPRRTPNAESDWPGAFALKEDADAAHDEHAYRSIAVPGLAEGLWTAHVFATKPWTELLAPAIELCEEGLELDWYGLLTIGSAANELSRFPASRNWFLPLGYPSSITGINRFRLRNPALTATLKALAERGGRDFYEGSIAHAFASDAVEGGALIDKADLHAYRAQLLEPAVVMRGGKRFLMPPHAAIGKMFREIIGGSQEWKSTVDRSTFLKYAHLFSAAHAEYSNVGAEIPDGWSSHVSVIDGEGNMASLSQSLGSTFGSKIVLPETGILVNNAAPATRDRPSDTDPSRGAVRTTNHLLPMLGVSGDRPWLALGVSGDRHILPTIVQLISFLIDFGFSVEDAFSHPRIGIRRPGEIQIDSTASLDVRQAIEQVFRVAELPFSLYPFSRPCAVAVGVDFFSGDRIAMTETSEPWAGSSAAH
ncbi:MAG: gamma-glutamyltransferase [Planctomycetia bacterium]|nr:gamma-glutamyltransferase [Planctomycetia bacterium]